MVPTSQTATPQQASVSSTFREKMNKKLYLKEGAVEK
jgi:hypothetical protein